jgi:hypothetical protein
MKSMLRHLRIVKGFFLRHGIAVLCVCGVIAAGTGVASSEETGVRETHVRGEAAEMHLPTDQPLTPWVHAPAILEKDEGDRTELREVVEQEATTIKLENLVPPIHFGLGQIEITEDYLKMLRDVLDGMRGRANVRLHFVGHADTLPLRGELINIYGDNIGLRSHLLRGAWRQQTGCKQCDGRRTAAQPARGSAGLVRRDQRKADRKGNGHPPRGEPHQGLPDRDRLQIAL